MQEEITHRRRQICLDAPAAHVADLVGFMQTACTLGLRMSNGQATRVVRTAEARVHTPYRKHKIALTYTALIK